MIQFQDVAVPLDAIDPPAVPLRESFDPQALGELADDLANNGLLQPIGLRGPSPGGRYEVVWGDRRSRAARMLDWTTIPARVCEWATPPELARIAENLQRADLNPREEARAIEALRKQGRPVAEIARLMRRSVGWVDARLELLTWPVELADQVAAGALSFAVARLLAEIDHTEYRSSLVHEAQRSGATAAVVSVWLAHYQVDRDRIIRNAETVEQVIGRRETFIVKYLCESCSEERDSRESVLLRICPDCLANLRQAQREERAGR